MKFARPLLFVLAIGVLLGGAGCTANMRKARALSRAREYVAHGEYEKAEIEYMNILQIKMLDPDAISGLGVLYFDEGRIGVVYTYLTKAQELQPENLAVRNRLAQLYLAANRFKDARDEAIYILQHKPDDRDAPVLLAQACTQRADLNGAAAVLKSLPDAVRAKAPVITASGIMNLRIGNTYAAESAFKQALQVDPKFGPAHLGLASLYGTRNEPAHAADELEMAAQLSDIRSGTRVQFAQFEMQRGYMDVARHTLEEIVAKAPDCLPPYILLSKLNAQEQKLDPALDLVSKALARDNTNPEAITLRAQLYLAKGEKDKAIADLEHAVSLYPQSPQLQFQLGTTAAAAGDLGQASASLAEAIRLDPKYTTAMMALAEVNLRQNNFAGALGWLQKLEKLNPGSSDVQFALADVYARQGDTARALAQYEKLEKALPRNPKPAFLSGLVELQQDKPDDARAAFERALKIDPTYLAALEQVADIFLRRKQFEAARERVSAQIKLMDPKASGPYLILAKTYLEEGDLKAGEATLKQVIAMQPDQVVPYMLLAQLYIGTKQQEKALANLQIAHKNDPGNAESLMLTAAIYNQQKKYDQAREYYEQTLKVNPRFSAALNNLAFIYSEHLNNVERAFALAQRARELLPNEPHTADTLGWIVYKRGDYAWALSLLTESGDRLPASADVQFHLGMANYMLGQEQLARGALERSLKLNPKMTGAETARAALATLDLDPAKASASDISTLEAAATKHPDPVALARLAAVQLRQGKSSEAISSYNAALKISPKDAHAMIGLAEVYRQVKQPDKAMELAKSARKLAPTDSSIAAVLGELAFDAKDYNWSASLLQEAAAGLPNDVDTLVAYAEAAYNTGQVSDAAQAAQGALALPPTSRTAEARDLAEFIDLANDGKRAAGQLDRIQKALEKDPNYVPAIMALGAGDEQKGDANAAIAAYRHARAELPNFAPAARRLTILLSADPKNDAEAAELAGKARDAYPGDADVAKAYGMILFRRGNFTRAAALLEESSRTRTNDGEILYYLGMCQGRLNNRTASATSLRRALELNLNPDLAAKARAALASSKG